MLARIIEKKYLLLCFKCRVSRIKWNKNNQLLVPTLPTSMKLYQKKMQSKNRNSKIRTRGFPATEDQTVGGNDHTEASADKCR